MKKYAAFFRGINVGGKNRVKMDELRKLFSDCGFVDIKTYIQSGNVIFASDKDKAILPDIISDAFMKKFGFQSAVILRSADEMASLMADFPFTEAEILEAQAITPDVEHVYIYLSNDEIDAVALEKLCQFYSGKDKLRVRKRELYLLCYQSIRDSNLAGLLTKLNTPLTSRNQKTMGKICSMLVDEGER